MAHIFKRPSGEKKGIIVFTHKEYNFLEEKNGPLSIKTSQPYPDLPIGYPVVDIKNYMLGSKDKKENVISSLKEDYVLGVHYIGTDEEIKDAGWVDFHMNRNPKFKSKYPEVIPIDGDVIVPKLFSEKENSNKYWDVISISHQARRKGIDILFEQVKRMYEEGDMINVLLVTVTRKEQDKLSFFNEMTEWYRRIFNKEEREHFTLMKLSSDMSFMGLSQNQINFFYNSSRVFVTFSDWEGGPRVVPESLLCGLPVVIRRPIRSNYPRLLNEENCYVVDECINGYKHIKSAIRSSKNSRVNTDRVAKMVREDYKICDLICSFKDLFEYMGIEFNKKITNTDNLNQRLHSHWHKGIPWSNGEHGTADIKTYNQLEVFHEYASRATE